MPEKKRRAEREMAFQALYGISFASVSGSGELRQAFARSLNASGKNTGATPTNFAWELVEGVWNACDKLDNIITLYSHNWRIDRMGRVELTLLRLALFEILFRHDVPPRMALTEALGLIRQFGAHDAKSFVSGILDAVINAVENGELTGAD
ncbi:MAG: transcription antitermination factor NusB [Candidatus Desulfovibrio kirbyi]|uniref:Transcription antitermination protein NusB n=1 Tax=Candidatus Desulfovibrio kirbyi TaxID=2696086 RepID=A0A6L2R595_9BACT|nr:MAG: transcription antitermination factor NusB [Candidatus Desulfovibrio kirbyi]